MDALPAIAAILGALSLGVVSPGPSFVLVARTAVASSRGDGVAAALGMGLGGMLFSVLALLGLHTLLMRVDWLYVAFRIAGGLYLCYLAILLWRTAPAAPDIAVGPRQRSNVRRALVLGVTTQLSNPKTALVYASVFAALLPPHLPVWAFIMLPLAIFALEAGWYAVVAIAFSAPRPRAAYLRIKVWADRVAATVLGGLGLRLVFAAARD